MKRYFHTTVKPGATDADGKVLHYVDSEFQYLTLPDGSHVVVMMREHATPEPTWTELPHLLDAAPPPAAVAAALGSFAGIAGTDHTFHIARKLAALNPHFHP